ncbi:hypothetical protein SAMN06265182_0313 [Persephonella hydrogeniphila]|uniref:Uncharacterized protein n=1 Tax=Persephonella hydrogeniphila TaxID=198703 RepID=A0A285N131_9AQUI|nr:DUF692 domain-containing protein [Persephonella hydrogeniphila]SNZ03175.1 hypothetical protein SAMN06265182_0313 [Persephonella hydrogeniphila]
MWFDGEIKGTGLGLRTAFIEDIHDYDLKPEWFEIAPENWIKKGGYLRKLFEDIRKDFPVVCHGLSLSVGSPDPVNKYFLKELKDFLDYYEISIYSEHLSFSSLYGSYIYDLFPLPFTRELAEDMSQKISFIQDFLGREISLENASSYVELSGDMEETDFIGYIIEKTGCKLLLDVNNVYVNSCNHRFDPYLYIEKIKPEWVSYIHIAGHKKIKEDLILDTHGSEISQSVYQLLIFTLKKIGKKPVLLERDNNIPPYRELLNEYDYLREVVKNAV